ncbi:hypothetical protein Tco_1422351 [Tanacetum coccineum]
MSPSMEARIAEYVAAPAPPSPPPSPLSPWSPPLPQIPLPPLPPLPSSLHLPPPVPTSLPLPSSTTTTTTSLTIHTTTSRPYEVGESSTAAPRPTRGHRADYGFISTMGAKIRRLPYRLTGVTDDDIDCTSFITIGTVNNMPPKGTSASTARAAAVARAAAAARAVTAAAPMKTAAVEQLIKARVSAALSNHETLRNSTNGHGDGSHNSDTGIKGTVRTPRECTYKDFLNCKPLTFKGTEGVVMLS